MANRYTHLLAPGQIGRLQVRNRIVLPAMGTRFGSDTGSVTQQMIDYFARRAEGGAGLVIVQSSYVTPVRMVGALGLFEDQFIPGHSNVAEAVKEWGAGVAVQLQNQGAVLRGGKGPADMDREDLRNTVDLYVQAVRRAITAGYDGIEVHVAHGYLLNQFLSRVFNARTDEYGGSLENRLRYPTEVLRAIREYVGPDFPLWIRLSAEEKHPGGYGIDEAVEIAQALVESADLNAVHVSCGGKPNAYEWVVQPMAMPRGVLVSYAKRVASAVSVPVIAVGRINDPSLAEDVLATTPIEFVAIGRGLIADPDLPMKVARGQADRVRMCTACNYCHGKRTSEGLPMRCSVNAEVGRERRLHIRPADKAKRVLVVGGGPAGMEAARVLAERGHQPILCDRNDRLGGQGLLAVVPPHKEEWRNLLTYLKGEIQRLRVEVRLDTEVDLQTPQAMGTDAVIVAAGGTPHVPEGFGELGTTGVVLAQDVLNRQVSVSGRIIVVGGGYVGCEVAEWLTEQGNHVSMLVGRNETIAYNAEPLTRKLLTRRVGGLGIKIHSSVEVLSADGQAVRVRNRERREETIRADCVVLAVGMQPNLALYKALEMTGMPVWAVGDCLEPRGIAESVYEGAVAAMRV